MTSKRQQLVALIKSKGWQQRPEPFQLSSGEWSRDYVDGKLALARGDDLRLASEVVCEIAARRRVGFDVVGGLTMGSDPLAHGIALLSGCSWFSVRKEAKRHGKERRIEGTELRPEHRVLLLDDVVTTGGSVLQALAAVEEAGAAVVLAVTLLDRGRTAQQAFAERGIPYEPVATFADLGIAPVGGGIEAGGGN